MNHDWTLSRLDDYLDDALPANERREIEAHLAACEACCEELASIGALLDTAHDLKARPRAPGRDLWPGIAARIGAPPESDAEPEGPAPPRANPVRRARRTAWMPWWRWPALTLGTAVVFVLALRLGPRLAAISSGPEPGTSAPRTAALEGPALRETADGLAVEVDRARASLVRPATVDSGDTGGVWEVFDQNLAVLDGAIRDARTALARDPDNPVIQRSLLTAYQKELHLLRWASRVVRQG